LKTAFSILFSMLLTGIMLTGCKSLQPQMPAESYHYVPVKPQTSVVNLFADLDLGRLETLINQNTDSLLYEDNSLTDNDNDNLMLKAWKNGRIKIAMQGDVLLWEIPLRVAIKKSYFLLAFNRPMGDLIEADGEIKLRFRTSLSVSRDWSIKTTTTPDGYDWMQKPKVKIAGITIPITSVADILLKVNLNNYSQNIDKTLAGSINFREIAEKGWQMMFEPFKIPGDYNAWLMMTPYSISLMPIKGAGRNIRLGLMVTTDIECLVDKQPQVAKKSALPVIQSLEIPGDTFHINLLTDIPYATIERLTLEEVRDSVYTFGNKQLSFESLHIYGSNGKMAIQTNVNGSLRGTIYLTGTPYFNPADTTLRIKDLKIDLKTRNLWMKSAKWLFNGKVERSITAAFAIPFNTNMRELESNLTDFMNHRKLGYGFELNGKLTRTTVTDLMLTPESVKANLVISGKLAIGIQE
jgi:hypothetical protein